MAHNSFPNSFQFNESNACNETSQEWDTLEEMYTLRHKLEETRQSKEQSVREAQKIIDEKNDEVSELNEELKSKDNNLKSFKSNMLRECEELKAEIDRLNKNRNKAKVSADTPECSSDPGDQGNSPGYIHVGQYLGQHDDTYDQRRVQEDEQVRCRERISENTMNRPAYNSTPGTQNAGRYRDRPKREVHPEKYDGKRPWSNYKVHFRACKELNGWSDTEACIWLATCLTGNAVQVLGQNWSPEQCTYDELQTKLEKSFGPCSSAENYTMEFRGRRRRSNESLQDLGQALMQLVVMAYPGMNREAHDKLARDQFKDALEDGELRSAIFRSRPRNLEESVAAAVETECFLKAEKSRGRGKSVPLFSRTIDAQSNEPNSRLDKMENRLQDMMSMLQNMQPINTERRPNYSSGTPDRGPDKRKGKVTQCYYCHGEGHFKWDCPKFQQDNPQGFQEYLKYRESKFQGNDQWSNQGVMGRPKPGNQYPNGPTTQQVSTLKPSQEIPTIVISQS